MVSILGVYSWKSSVAFGVNHAFRDHPEHQDHQEGQLEHAKDQDHQDGQLDPLDLRGYYTKGERQQDNDQAGTFCPLLRSLLNLPETGLG